MKIVLRQINLPIEYHKYMLIQLYLLRHYLIYYISFQVYFRPNKHKDVDIYQMDE